MPCIVRVCGIPERNVPTCVFERDVLISYLQENTAAPLQGLVDGENNGCVERYGTRRYTLEVVLNQMMRNK